MEYSGDKVDAMDFFSMMKGDEEAVDGQEDQQCGITHDPLSLHHVTMKCGHKFNYIPLYNHLLNRKTNKEGLQYATKRLGVYEIECPYCRNVESGLLKYIPELGVREIWKINSANKNKAFRKTVVRKKVVAKKAPPHQPTPGMKIPINGTPPITCSTILCSGSRKGEICGLNAKKSYNKDGVTINVCGRHCKHQAKITSNDMNDIPTNPTDTPAILIPPQPNSNTHLGAIEAIMEMPPGSIVQTNTTCCSILKRGPRTGEMCGCPIKKPAIIGGIKFNMWCKSHCRPKYNIIQTYFSSLNK